QPAPPAIPLNMENVKVKIKEGSIYESNEAYPSDWISYNIGAGIENGKHVIFLSIHAFPCRYIPAKNELLCVDKMKIKVNYEPPKKPLMQNDVYDLLIIAPSEFSDALQPLVEHKENYNISTKIVTIDEIYGGTYFVVKGRDDAEKIKYFIKNAIEQWGIKYVLLVGNSEKFPIREAYAYDGEEAYFISDLYYADIYNKDG
ncbi:peptidase C25, partial [Thermoplasmatales archaeon ex4484_30]